MATKSNARLHPQAKAWGLDGKIDNISQITRLSKRVISQYLDLIPQHQLQTMDANLANSSANDEATEQGETQ